MAKILKFIMIIIIFTSISVFVLSYFVITTEITSSNQPKQWHFLPITNIKDQVLIREILESQNPYFQVTDGIGRELKPAPWMIKYFLGTNRLWAGWGWQLLDSLIFLSVMILIFSLNSWRNEYINDLDK
ncbi:hypothetical protein [Marinicella gelatinilytica]|uniref:hypothetical protein n=1 Tax=Marinicella gelatinilytica TaxID=2996017 RepID=UPI002260C798|nr:hypothetical protein [Marinicella gelatinilytica]MCX7545317.1 hypothetical protein [Marinicella gelatinilytica]